MDRISVVVPVFNEEGNIANLHKEIKDVCEKNNYIYEINRTQFEDFSRVKAL